jgi:cyclomaltodextrinase
MDRKLVRAARLGSKREFNDNMYYRRYGGDLQGVLDKLDYLQNLGVTALFMNPLNDAPSAHKYDARHYHHIDVNFGPDPEGDNNLIASRKPRRPGYLEMDGCR